MVICTILMLTAIYDFVQAKGFIDVWGGICLVLTAVVMEATYSLEAKRLAGKSVTRSES